jgi:hypothetical protein
MPEERANQLPEEENQNLESFESDTQKIIHRHLENEDDVITEEDIRNVRIGVFPPETLTTGNETEEEIEEELENISSDRIEEDYEDEAPSDNPITPWDMIDEEKTEGV